jgi:peptidoglycan/xylan/chitin deacetylase (PgdA/CDA1 family)
MHVRYALLVLSSVAAFSCAGNDVSTELGEETGDGLDESNLRPTDVVYETQLRGADLGSKEIHLTLDDGPGKRTAELATYLQDEGIVATFFINGVNVPGREQALRDIVSRGHLLANHSQNHLLLSRETAAKVADEIAKTDAIVRRYQPGRPVYFRAPYAGFNTALVRQLTNYPSPQIGPIHWDIGTKITGASAADWECWSKGVSVQRCADLYVAEVVAKGRGIVLMHDIHSRSVDMIKLMVPKLRALGYKFVSLEKSPGIVRAREDGIPSIPSNKCLSGTLFRLVGEGTCVESSHEKQWRVCRSGEWAPKLETTRCAEQFPLAPVR